MIPPKAAPPPVATAVRLPYIINGIETHLQNRATRKFAERLRVRHGAAHIGALTNGDFAADHNVFRDTTRKRLARLADF